MDFLWFPIDFLWFSLQLQPICWFILRQKLAETLAWGPRPSATTLRCLSTNGFQATMARGNLQETSVFWICLAPSTCSEHKNLGAKRSKSSEIGSSRIQVTQTAQSHLDAEYAQNSQTNKSWLVAWYNWDVFLFPAPSQNKSRNAQRQIAETTWYTFISSIWVCHIVFSCIPWFHCRVYVSVSHPLAWASKNLQRLSSTETSFHAVTLVRLTALLHVHLHDHGFQMFSVSCSILFISFHYFPHLSLCDWGSSWVIRCHPYSTHKTNATLLRKFRRVPIAVHSLLSGLAHAMYEEHTNQ